MNVVVSYFESNVNPVQVHVPHVLVKREHQSVNGVNKVTLHLRLVTSEKGLASVSVGKDYNMALIKKQKGKTRVQVIDHTQYNQIMLRCFI